MEQFRETLKKRTAEMGGINVIALLFIFVMGRYGLVVVGSSENISDYIHGFQIGIFLGVQIIMLLTIGKYRQAMKDSGKLKELYIKENDERAKLIRDKIGGAGFFLSMGIIAVAVITAGFFNETVFFTLSATLIFLGLVKLILKLYYTKKY
ncbi:hypothetical protein J2T13_002173 [Paenibacillus sp. DS2015]|uniref:hypothetical protein n=1 Tax=Paenibacillus sp. DS2015 TaxID=3373917 RepID=UPI003D1DEF7D